MIRLKIFKDENGQLITNKGVYTTMDYCMVSEETGEVFFVAGSTTDRNRKLCELMVENA